MSTFTVLHETCNTLLDQTKSATVLDLCCGNGQLSKLLTFESITGVDAYQPYLDAFMDAMPEHAEGLLMDLTEDPLDSIEDNTYDAVLCIDGVEHLEHEKAVRLMDNMERVAKKLVVIFTPINLHNPEVPVLNTPHSSWGIEGGAEWQTHKSAHLPNYFLNNGYVINMDSIGKNQYDGTSYREMLYSKILENNNES